MLAVCFVLVMCFVVTCGWFLDGCVAALICCLVVDFGVCYLYDF